MNDRVRCPTPTLDEYFDLERCFLGGTVKIGPTGRDGLGPARVLRLQAKDRRRPIVVTASFDVKLLTPLTTDPFHLPRLHLTWGSEQGGGDALVDLRHGMRVALEMTDLQVDAIYHTITTTFAQTNGPDIQVVSSVGFGSVGDQNLTLTEDSVLVNAVANSTSITVPSYARSLEIQSDQDPTVAIPNSFSVTLNRGTAAGGRILAMYDERDMPITLPNGSETLVIRNLGPGTATYTPVFHLTL